jgi:CO/xanthine dehydrogenase FAD-binding subunit
MDASVVIASEGQEREVKLTEFFLGPGQSVLQPNELLKEIRISPLPPRSGTNYLRLSYRDVLDLAIVGVATCVTLEPDRTIKEARVALGAVAPRPIRAEKTEALLRGQPLTEDLIVEAGQMAAQEATPISDQRSSADYRTDMTAVLTKRSLRSAADAAEGKRKKR